MLGPIQIVSNSSFLAGVINVIVGIGVDIIEIDRIDASIRRFGDRFLRKIFTDEEIAMCRGTAFPSQHFAARFSAKEALSKALATGYAGEFEWHNAEVTTDRLGKASFIFHRATARLLQHADVHLTMSHSDSAVTAFVIIAVQ